MNKYKILDNLQISNDFHQYIHNILIFSYYNLQKNLQ